MIEARKTLKEPKGHKTRIKLQIKKREPVSPDKLTSWPVKAHDKLDDTIRSKTVIRPNYWEIDTRNKLAYVVWRNFGDGINEVYGYDCFQKNKNYNPQFECTAPDCKYINHENPKRRCHIWKRWKRGWQCKANSRIKPNWKRIAIIKIESQEEAWLHEGTLEALKYIKFEYTRKPFKMHSYWFWKDR